MASSLSLKGKVALITGCTGGIGKATARSLALKGASIAVHYHSATETANSLVKELKSHGVDAVAFKATGFAIFSADLSTYEATRALHHAVTEFMGAPDILFCNSGILGKTIGPKGDIQDIPVELFEETWRTNTGVHYLLTQLVLPAMESKKWGRIIYCSSVAAGTGGVIGPHYASSKSAMHGLVHWLAGKYAPEGITVNAVAPALITNTGMFPGNQAELRARIPVGRFGEPEEIASVVEMFTTNAYLTNKIYVVDGGMTPSAF
ncbi:NAD-binding protein [Ramaria rubella]|nr:NAD-binding protein [Ramaria rubella]